MLAAIPCRMATAPGQISSSCGHRLQAPPRQCSFWIMSKLRSNKPVSALSNGGASGEIDRGALSPTTPLQTDPVSDAQRGAWFEGQDAITAIREYDGAVEFDLPRDVARFTAGAARSRDAVLRGRGRSALHSA